LLHSQVSRRTSRGGTLGSTCSSALEAFTVPLLLLVQSVYLPRPGANPFQRSAPLSPTAVDRHYGKCIATCWRMLQYSIAYSTMASLMPTFLSRSLPVVPPRLLIWETGRPLLLRPHSAFLVVPFLLSADAELQQNSRDGFVGAPFGPSLTVCRTCVRHVACMVTRMHILYAHTCRVHGIWHAIFVCMLCAGAAARHGSV
jgi:hypothetical protein